jgi:protein gp37
MSDLFLEDVPTEYIAKVGRTMETANWHTYQILTKRHDRMRELLAGELKWMSALRNVWFGVSVEDREHGLPRLKSLQRTSASVRFLSIEPLLEDLGRLDLRKIDWVIVGGESGHGARPMKREWVISILKQCECAGVPFFFKQWGGVHKSKAGRMLKGRTYDNVPTI